MDVIWVLLLLWGLPILIGYGLGQRRNRAGWAYGLLLGWLGVGILALTSYLPSKQEVLVRELEAREKLARMLPPPEPVQAVAEQGSWKDRF